MAVDYFGNNFVHLYVSELTSRIVAESGIANDRFHVGKIILQSLKDDPEFIMQIDGATGQSENYGSVLKRTIQCAAFLQKMGLKKNDVLVLMAPNHLDLTIPFYAGWCLGLSVAPIDRTMIINELKHSLGTLKPSVLFCQSEKVQDVIETIKFLGLDTKIISFDKSPDALHFLELLESEKDVDINGFKPTDIDDPEETIALLIPTSGTTGLPKSAALTYKHVAIAGPYAWCFATKFPMPTQSALLAAPLQWLTSLAHFMISPYIKYTRIQTSQPVTLQHLYELIKKYKPTFFISSPTMLSALTKIGEVDNYDFSNFELLYVAGSAVPKELVKHIKTLSPKTIVQDTFGISELGTAVFQSVGAPLGSSGTRMGHIQYRLVDTETKTDVREPHKNGELWVKGPGVFKGYYNNSKATEEAFSKDGWFMTGDLMYRDEGWNYYFVDRIKSLLKYKGFQISPVEVEAVIRQHPGVLDVAVTGVPDPECGELAVACVVPRPGTKPTPEEINHLVKENLSDSKQLRGGVIFLSEMPLTASTKVNRPKIKQIVLERINELQIRRD